MKKTHISAALMLCMSLLTTQANAGDIEYILRWEDQPTQQFKFGKPGGSVKNGGSANFDEVRKFYNKTLGQIETASPNKGVGVQVNLDQSSWSNLGTSAEITNNSRQLGGHSGYLRNSIYVTKSDFAQVEKGLEIRVVPSTRFKNVKTSILDIDSVIFEQLGGSVYDDSKNAHADNVIVKVGGQEVDGRGGIGSPNYSKCITFIPSSYDGTDGAVYASSYTRGWAFRIENDVQCNAQYPGGYITGSHSVPNNVNRGNLNLNIPELTTQKFLSFDLHPSGLGVGFTILGAFTTTQSIGLSDITFRSADNDGDLHGDVIDDFDNDRCSVKSLNDRGCIVATVASDLPVGTVAEEAFTFTINTDKAFTQSSVPTSSFTVNKGSITSVQRISNQRLKVTVTPPTNDAGSITLTIKENAVTPSGTNLGNQTASADQIFNTEIPASCEADPNSNACACDTDPTTQGCDSAACQADITSQACTCELDASAIGCDTTPPGKPILIPYDTGDVMIKANPEPADTAQMIVDYVDEDDRPAKAILTKSPDANGTWSSDDPNIVVQDENAGSFILLAGAVKDGSTVTAKAADFEGNQSDIATAEVAANDDTATGCPVDTSLPCDPKIDKTDCTTDDTRPECQEPASPTDNTPPNVPSLTPTDDGGVEVKPSDDANDDTQKIEVTFTDEDGNPQVAVLTKGDDDKWTSNHPDVSVDPDTGKATIDGDAIKDGTEVAAVAVDASQNRSEQVKIKVLAATLKNVILKSSFEAVLLKQKYQSVESLLASINN